MINIKKIASMKNTILTLGLVCFAICYGAWDKDKPAATTSLRASNPEMLENQSSLETAIDNEHAFATGGTQTGDHTQGSARAFSQASAPATQVDGGAFVSTDLGSIWVDTDDNAVYVLTATVPTWTPVSTEVISTLLGSARVFTSTLGVTGNFAVNADKFTVTASSGNTLVAGTLDVTGNIDPTSYETTNGGFLDEDNLISDSATAVASQQSIKAYTDNATSGADPVLKDSESNDMVKAHAYQAQTAGFVTAWADASTSNPLDAFVGGTSDPAGAGTKVGRSDGTVQIIPFVSFFVAKDNYFELTHGFVDVTITWTPLIAGGGNPIDNN